MEGERQGGERGEGGKRKEGRREGGERKGLEAGTRRKGRRKRKEKQEWRGEGREIGKNSVRQDPRNPCALDQISVTLGIFCILFIHTHIHS